MSSRNQWVVVGLDFYKYKIDIFIQVIMTGCIINMDNIGPNAGYLELIFGPMYSGKTSKLLELYKQFCFCEIPTTVINYKEDTR